MAAGVPRRSGGGGGRPTSRRRRQLVPLLYIGVALVTAGLVLPSALRPPPSPADTSGALSPNAPRTQSNPNQIIESLQEAGGGGAGGPGTVTSTTTSTTLAGPPPTLPTRASLEYCYGNPPRQIPSVYSGPCVGAWQGDNGGTTSLNVFPNQIRIGIDGLDSPSAGALPDASSDNASTGSATETWQALEEYFDLHFQLYDRKIAFYGTGDPADQTADSYAANATTLAQTYKLWAVSDNNAGVCEDFEQYGLVAMCNPLPHQDYLEYRPGLFSDWQMDLNEYFGFGAEFLCKSLAGGPASFAGPGLTGKPRKFGFISSEGLDGGISADVFAQAVKSECGVTVETATLDDDSDADIAQGAASTIARFQADGITTIGFSLEVGDILLAMEAASKSAYFPEWDMLGTYAVDNNTIATAMPQDESSHLFGLTTWEWPQAFQTTECAQAVESVDPSLSPNSTICYQWWSTLVWLMDGIQGAGPDLTPARFQQALFNLGYHYNMTPWAMGGGFGPGDYSFPDSVAEIWYSSTAQDPTSGAAGAFEFLYDGHRFQRGQLPSGDSQLFKAGSPEAPSTCTPTPPPC